MNKVGSYCIAVSVVLELRNMDLPPSVDRSLYLEKSLKYLEITARLGWVHVVRDGQKISVWLPQLIRTPRVLPKGGGPW